MKDQKGLIGIAIGCFAVAMIAIGYAIGHEVGVNNIIDVYEEDSKKRKRK